MKKRKAQSEIITKVLIILLILSAIVVVWYAVKNVVSESSDVITIDNVNLNIEYVYYDESFAPPRIEVGVNRLAGKGEIDSLKFILTDENSINYVYDYTNPAGIPDELEKFVYFVYSSDLGNIDLSKIKKVSLAYSGKTSSGKEIIIDSKQGGVEPKKTISSGGGGGGGGSTYNPAPPNIVDEGITYYISNSGNDLNDGKSEEKPIKTIARLNAIFLYPGDKVLFKSGDVWRLPVNIPGIQPADGVVYGSYGNGNKPLLLASVEANSESDWVEETEGSNIWRYAPLIQTEVGNIIFNNEASVGVIALKKSDLNTQGEFYYDHISQWTGNYTYLYSLGNPALLYTNIELALEKDIFNMHDGQHDILIENLDMRYTSYNAIDLHQTYNISIKNNYFSYIGGGISGQEDIFGTTSRWGNGIEVWEDNHDILIENNTFNQIYDQSIGIEGSAENGAYYQYNIMFRNNVISNTEGCWIFFQSDFNLNNPGIIDSILKNLTIKHNTCYDTGNTWANGQRYGNSIGKCFWLGGMDGTLTENGKDIIVKDNICYLNNGNYISKSPWASGNNPVIDYNLYFKVNADSYPLVNWNGINLFNSFSGYQASGLNQDQNSYEALPTDPLFNDAANYDLRPAANSPACTISSTGNYVGALPCMS